jgi:hypothetical protein
MYKHLTYRPERIEKKQEAKTTLPNQNILPIFYCYYFTTQYPKGSKIAKK